MKHTIVRITAIMTLFSLLVTGLFYLLHLSAGPAPAAGGSAIFMPVAAQAEAFAALPVGSGFNRVTAITNAGDDRLFVTEQAGLIKIYHPNGSTSTFLDLRSRVIFQGAEQGLFTIVFHPDYATNGYFYLSYTGTVWNQNDVWLIVSRFNISANPDVANPNSEWQLLTIKQDSPIHNGGGMDFNPLDGLLYLGVGEDAQSLTAQDWQSLKGKILQIDVDSTATLQTAEATAVVPITIWTLGLRNPWQLGIDPVSGATYIGDVGSSIWEEVNYLPYNSFGQNFGWPCMEGPDVRMTGGACGSPGSYALPVHYYSNGVDGCAVIAGEVYRPFTNPRFLFGDYCRADISSLATSGGWQATRLGELPGEDFLTTFGFDNQGNIYAGTTAVSGPLYRLAIP